MIALDDPSPDLESHARVGGGRVFTLDQTDALASFLGDDARTRLERQDYPLLFWRDWGPAGLLLSALVPLILLFRRRAA